VPSIRISQLAKSCLKRRFLRAYPDLPVTVQPPSPESGSALQESVGYRGSQPQTGGGSERLHLRHDQDHKETMQPDKIESLAAKAIPADELRPTSIDEVAKLPPFCAKMAEVAQLCGTKYSEVDLAVQDALVLRRLQQMTNTLLLNPLWSERLRQAGVNEAPRSIEDWQHIPISDKGVIRDFFMGSRPGLAVPISYNGFEIVASGGTSDGLPIETVYSLRELHDTYRIAGSFMGDYVLRDYLSGDLPKWVATTLADYQMWSSGTMVGGVLQNIPGINYIGAGPVTAEVFRHMLSYPGPKAIMGISQGIAILSELGKDASEEARGSLRVALYGSGVLPQRKRIELKEVYPNISIMSYFAATQAETIGLQLQPDSYLAAVPGLHLIEIVDENGRAVEEGQEGELVVTRLHAHEAPLPRYRLGDRMIRRPDVIGPGLKTRQFEFSGRSGDIIHLCDTQYSAPLVYSSLCRKLREAPVFDLETLAHEVQFFNHRKEKMLYLLAAVDDPESLTAKLTDALGQDGAKKLFVESLVSSLSLFNKGEANRYSIDKTGYDFVIKPVSRGSQEIFRTYVGKTPLLRDVF
jgi:phenylacetate-CoA ligase